MFCEPIYARYLIVIFQGSYGSEDKIQIFVKMSTIANESEPDYEASVHDGDFEETVRRLQNVRIKYFHFGVRDNAFLRYWVVQETAAFTVVSIDFFDRPEAKDYGLLDAIVNHLRPRTAQFNDYESSWHELLKFLYRDSFLRNLQTCRLNVSISPIVVNFCEFLRSLFHLGSWVMFRWDLEMLFLHLLSSSRSLDTGTTCCGSPTLT